MKKVILLMGLPRSGKSTIAQELHAELGYPIVCPDDFRKATHGEDFVASAERFIWSATFVAGRALLRRHEGIIVDACNRSRERRDEWRREMDLAGQALVVQVFEVDTSSSVCLNRTNNPKLKVAIERMAKAYEHRMADEPRFELPSRMNFQPSL